MNKILHKVATKLFWIERILNSKHEIRNSKQSQNNKSKFSKLVLDFRYWILGFARPVKYVLIHFWV